VFWAVRMATSSINNVIQQVRKTILASDAIGLTDGQLLTYFIEQQDDAAFAALVRRHGPMVWGVCCRLLQSHHDAEDAFQATFLVLVHKAGSVMPREMVANWLHGVACTTANRARVARAKRHSREMQVKEMPEPETAVPAVWTDVKPVLDLELSHLPVKYRVVLLLCDMEGKTRKEVARQLGLPEGTVAGQLARARTMLAKRLSKRGVVLSGGSLALGLSQNGAPACVPPSVVSTTIHVATSVAAGKTVAAAVISAEVATLAEGVLTTMFLSKLKLALAGLFVICALSAGVARFAFAWGGNEAGVGKEKDVAAKKSTSPQGEKAKEAKDLVLGTWKIVSAESNGKAVSDEGTEGDTVVITAGAITITSKTGGKLVMGFRLDPSQTPEAIDVTPEEPDPSAGDVLKGIYEFQGDRLTICFSRNTAPGAARPSKFSAERRGDRVYVLERIPGPKDKDDSEKKKKDDAVKKAQEQLQGEWVLTEVHSKGKKLNEQEARFLAGVKWTFKGKEILEESPEGNQSMRNFSVDPSKKPSWLDLEQPEMAMVYEINGDKLRVAFHDEDTKKRPTGLKTTPDTDNLVALVFQRQKKEKLPDEELSDKKPAPLWKGLGPLKDDSVAGRWFAENFNRFEMQLFNGTSELAPVGFVTNEKTVKKGPAGGVFLVTKEEAASIVQTFVDSGLWGRSDQVPLGPLGPGRFLGLAPSDATTEAGWIWGLGRQDEDVSSRVIIQHLLQISTGEREKAIKAWLAQSVKAKAEVEKPKDGIAPLKEGLDKLDAMRNGDQTKFDSVEKQGAALLAAYTKPGEQAKIHFMLAHVYGQSGIDKNPDRVSKYARLALQHERDPIQRGWLHMYLGDSAQVDPALGAFPARRKEAAQRYLQGYKELLALKLPATAPEFPPQPALNFETTDPIKLAEVKEQSDAYWKARKEAEFLREMVHRRDILIGQCAQMYRRSPAANEELQQLAENALKDRQVAREFLTTVAKWKGVWEK
jgi:RNA polymerase sigma factor (sigma-70 family)